MGSAYTPTDTERDVARLIADGYARWAISIKLGLSDERVRDVIRNLCRRFDCPTIEVPEFLGMPMLGDDEYDGDDGETRVDASDAEV